jgi:hypothetical protein
VTAGPDDGATVDGRALLAATAAELSSLSTRIDRVEDSVSDLMACGGRTEGTDPRALQDLDAIRQSLGALARMVDDLARHTGFRPGRVPRGPAAAVPLGALRRALLDEAAGPSDAAQRAKDGGAAVEFF